MQYYITSYQMLIALFIPSSNKGHFMGFPILIICYPSEPFILILAKVIFVIYTLNWGETITGHPRISNRKCSSQLFLNQLPLVNNICFILIITIHITAEQMQTNYDCMCAFSLGEIFRSQLLLNMQTEIWFMRYVKASTFKMQI